MSHDFIASFLKKQSSGLYIQHRSGKNGSAGPECSLLTTKVTNSGNSRCCWAKYTRQSGRLQCGTRVVPHGPAVQLVKCDQTSGSPTLLS